MKSRNISGPMIDPRGAPGVTSIKEEKQSPILTYLVIICSITDVCDSKFLYLISYKIYIKILPTQ